MNVLHFKHNYAHRASVFYLYRNILRSARKINLDHEFRNTVKRSFKEGSKLNSPWKSANALMNANKLLSKLQTSLQKENDQKGEPSHLDWQQTLLPVSDENSMIRIQKHTYKIPTGKKLSHNVAPNKIVQIEASRVQSLKSKIKRYVFKYQHRRIPEKSINLNDPEFVKILMELQYKKCLKELRRLDYLFNYKGPFKVKVVNLQIGPDVGSIKQLNLPFKHNKALSYYITTTKKYQAELLLNTKNKYFLAQSEAEWEYEIYKVKNPDIIAKLNDSQKSKLLNYFIKQWLFVDNFLINSLSKKFNLVQKRFSVFNKRAPMLQKNYQKKFNQYFQERLSKYQSLMEDMKMIEGLSSASNSLLCDLLKKHEFIKSDVQWYV